MRDRQRERELRDDFMNTPMPLPVAWSAIAEATGHMQSGALWMVEGGYNSFKTGLALHLAAFAVRAGKVAIIVSDDYGDMENAVARVERINGQPPRRQIAFVPYTGSSGVHGAALLVQHLAEQLHASLVIFDGVPFTELLAHGAELLGAGGRHPMRVIVRQYWGDLRSVQAEATFHSEVVRMAGVIVDTALDHEATPARLRARVLKAPNLGARAVQLDGVVVDGVIQVNDAR